ncbi:hypothetical protein A8M56_21210 [Yersinia pestis]|nr:hypothetical protein A8M56_21210 [Yersinia pestis]
MLTLMFSLLIFDAYANEPKVCFYMDDDYNGESLCAAQGNSVASIPDKWNDRISSISIPHGLVVTVYEDVDFWALLGLLKPMWIWFQIRI